MFLTEQKPSRKKFFLLSIVAALLTFVFVILGAPLLRVLRNQYGAKLFWSTGLVFALLLGMVPGLVPMAYLFGSTWLVVGLYSELEERGWANFWSALSVVILGTVIVVLGPILWAKSLGVDLSAVLSESIDQLLAKIQSANTTTSEQSLVSGMKVDANLVISQVPSVMFILHLTSLAFALMFDLKTATLFGIRFERIASQIRLLEFRVPDFFIWIMMFSFLLTFMKVGNETVTMVAMNLFNSFVGIYFFQGLAVLEVLLLILRAGTFTRIIVYFVIVGQLFFLLSIVGVVDFWADFRKRFRKKGIKENNQNNGEHI